MEYIATFCHTAFELTDDDTAGFTGLKCVQFAFCLYVMCLSVCLSLCLSVCLVVAAIWQTKSSNRYGSKYLPLKAYVIRCEKAISSSVMFVI